MSERWVVYLKSFYIHVHVESVFFITIQHLSEEQEQYDVIHFQTAL